MELLENSTYSKAISLVNAVDLFSARASVFGYLSHVSGHPTALVSLWLHSPKQTTANREKILKIDLGMHSPNVRRLEHHSFPPPGFSK
jgi:hypothetical protein